MERQGIPAVNIFLERDTDRTPDRTKYYVFSGSEILAAYKSKRRALQIYKEAVAASGYMPPKTEEIAVEGDGLNSIQRDRLDHGFEQSEVYWDSTRLYRKRGPHR